MRQAEDSKAILTRLAQEAGRDPATLALAREWRNRTPARDQVVWRLDDPGGVSLIFKHVRKPDDPAPFARAMTAQMHAQAVMAGGLAGVPELLALDLETRACLMAHVPGRDVHAVIAGGGDGHAALRDAGRWIAAFHDATFAETRVFQPRFMRDHLHHLTRQIAAGDIILPRPRAFLRHAETVIATAPHHEGQTTRSARTHGDMNLRNILLDGPRSWGLDFTATHTAPVGFDIARFLLHYTALFAELPLPRGHIVPDHALSAFFEGYGAVGPDDASVQYLLRVRLLMDWAAIPASAHRQSAPQARRLDRLARLAKTALQ